MAAKFGNTWWGEAWLNALSNIDYENRIPRGASYARKGAVSSLKIKGNIVEAKVQGTRRTPYKVMIVLPKFMREEINIFIDRLLEKPALITAMLQRTLSPEVARIASDCGLKLFPSRWSDLKMNCNCPDWAVPCKHIASVVYMLSREIDNNPFIIFEMHGIDLIEELKNRGVNLQAQATQVQPIASKTLLVKSKARKRSSDVEPELSNTMEPALTADFTSLKSIADASTLLLPDAPPFYVNGNFKELYLTGIKRMAKTMRRFLDGRLVVEVLFPCEEQDLSISSDSAISFTINDLLEWKAFVADFDGAASVDLNHLFKTVATINRDFLPDYDPTVRALHTSIYAAIHLVANSLIKPEIVKLPGGEYTVIWIPLPSDASVEKVMTAIADAMPQGMVKAVNKEGEKKTPLQNQAQLLLARIITTLMHPQYPIINDASEITNMFFKGAIHKFGGIGEKEIPGSIRVWCDSIIIKDEQWCPVIYIEDKGEGHDSFSLMISINSSNPYRGEEIPLTQALKSEEWSNVKFDIIDSVLRLSNVIPGLNEYINRGATGAIDFNDTQFADFIINIIPSMRMLGLKVYLPKSLESLLRPKATLHLFENNDRQSMFVLDDFFAYDWRVAIGSEIIDMQTFEKMLKNAEGLIRFKKSYIYVSPEDMAKIKAKLNSTVVLSPAELLQAALSEEYDGVPVELSEAVRHTMAEIKSCEPTPIPEGLNAKLRPYQQRGFSWLYRNMKIGFGSILADDMGLGKTLQAIALMLKIKEEKGFTDSKALVVAPVGLLNNWESEIQRFAPTLSTHIYHGVTRNLKSAKDADVVLTSYGMLRSDVAKIKKGHWRIFVIDEAQNIKNPKTAQTKAVVSINAGCKIALSGTPVENRLSEYWSIMHYANKGYLGSLSDFNDKFVKPIQVFNDIRSANQLKKITAPFLMRRMKTDKSIISDLPDKVERNVFTTLTPEQAALYEQTLNEAMAIIEGMPVGTQKELFKRQGIILQMILALKQICDHPVLFLKNGQIDASLSGKIQVLIDRVQSIVDANDKVLIFTQYREMGKILQQILEKHIGQRPLFYHGGSSLKERTEMVNKFQNSRGNQIFILSLKAAGTGLNLTAATNVIHYDLWWNPAVEAQATDRAYRIGQKRNVMVDRFITTGTFEERINAMIESKRHLAEMTVATGETWIGNLSNKELHELFDR